MGKLPAFLFYPMDWRTDPALCRVSKSARDTWLDMICLMFYSEERGFLVSGGSAWSDQEIAGAVRGDSAGNLRDIAELLAKGVAFRDNRGAVFSKRLVRDEQERQASASRMRMKRKKVRYGNVTPHVTPLSETENETETKDVKTLKPKTKPSKKNNNGCRLPEDYIPQSEHYQLARDLGVNCDMEFQKFRDYFLGVAGTRAVKRDWGATFRNWLRNAVNFGGHSHAREPSKAEQRVARSRENILVGLGIGKPSGPGSSDLRGRNHERPNESLVHMLPRGKPRDA